MIKYYFFIIWKKINRKNFMFVDGKCDKYE